MAIDDPTGKLDSTFSNNVSRRRFIEVSVGAVACVSLSSLMSGCGGSIHSEGDIRFLPRFIQLARGP